MSKFLVLYSSGDDSPSILDSSKYSITFTACNVWLQPCLWQLLPSFRTPNGGQRGDGSRFEDSLLGRNQTSNVISRGCKNKTTSFGIFLCVEQAMLFGSYKTGRLQLLLCTIQDYIFLICCIILGPSLHSKLIEFLALSEVNLL